MSNNNNPYGEMTVPETPSTPKPLDVDTQPFPKRESRALGAKSPVPAGMMVVVDTSVLRDTIVDISGRVDQLEDVNETARGEQQAEAAELREQLATQDAKLEELAKKLAECEAANQQLVEQQQKKEQEGQAVIEQLVARITALESADVGESDWGKVVMAKLEEHDTGLLGIQVISNQVNSVEAQLQERAAAVEKQASATKSHLSKLIVGLQKRIGEVELHTGCKHSEEKVASSWKKSKTAMIFAAKMTHSKKDALEERAQEHERLQAEFAEKPTDEILKAKLEQSEAAQKQLEKEVKEAEEKLKASQVEEEKVSEVDPDAPSLTEQMQALKDELGLIKGDGFEVKKSVKAQEGEIEETQTKLEELDHKFTKMMNRKNKREQSNTGNNTGTGGGDTGSPLASPGAAVVDTRALDELTERVGRLEEDLDYEMGLLQDSMDSKADDAKVVEDLGKMHQRANTIDEGIKNLSDRCDKLARAAGGGATGPDGKQVSLLELDSAIRDLKEEKMERHETLGIEQQLRNTIKIMTDEMTMMKKHLVHLGSSSSGGGSNADVDKVTAALQSKIQSMNEAFGQRCKDMETNITSIGAAGNTIAPKGQCLSCSRPTSVTDHVVRPKSPPREHSRPPSRQVPQRYYHKPAKYSSALEENGWPAPVIDPHRTLPARPRTNHSDRPASLAPLGRPVSRGSDSAPMNLSALSANSQILDAPFKRTAACTPSFPHPQPTIIRPNSVM